MAKFVRVCEDDRWTGRMHDLRLDHSHHVGQTGGEGRTDTAAALAYHSTSAHRSLGTNALYCKRVREPDSRSDSTNRIS
ncbi:unnamed protein product [Parnassius apollo]|uniref:(apollo) hypothetical protein n=1 Tax=Parnassius apollo TaxID=110799 RepID=A0A8S3WLI7_PARAO|nr:unnamed protein product [Parnassius apollo]